MLRRFLLFAACAPAVAQPLADVPADFTNVLVVRDVLPALQRLVDSPVLAELWESSPALAAELQEHGVTLGGVRSAVRLFARDVPREITVAMAPETTAAAGRVVGTMLRLLLLDAGEVKDRAAKLLRDEIAADVDALAALRVMVRVRMRDAERAKFWWDRICDAVDGLPADGVEVAEAEDRLDVRLQLGKLPALRLPGPFASLREHVAALAYACELRREDDAIVLRVGSGKGALQPERLGPLWQDDARQLLFYHADLDPLLSVAVDLHATLARDQRALFTMLSARPEAALLVARIMAEMEALDERTSGAFALLDGGCEWLEYGASSEPDEPPVADPARGPGRLVATDLGALVVTGASLDDFAYRLLASVRNVVTQYASRLLRRAPEDAAELFDDRVAALTEYLEGEESAMFEPGAALVLGPATAITELSLRDDRDEPIAQWQPKELSVPAVALAGRLAAPTQAWPVAEEFIGRLAGVLIERAAPIELVETDLGLEVPTRAVTWSADDEGERHLRVAGEFCPHWFLLDDTLVFSTSVALSKAMLARARGDGAPHQPQALWAHVSGEQMTRLVQCVGSALAALDDPAAKPLRAALGLPAPRIGPWTAEFATWFDRVRSVETRATDDGEQRRSRTVVLWK
ncbi:MAG TPA: hypothetical protein VK081_14820 [Planctomycetota bacterium]|nr:hypothetical protein [Planctomycetota bacterium]